MALFGSDSYTPKHMAQSSDLPADFTLMEPVINTCAEIVPPGF